MEYSDPQKYACCVLASIVLSSFVKKTKENEDLDTKSQIDF